jgi:hypothetical protein
MPWVSRSLRGASRSSNSGQRSSTIELPVVHAPLVPESSGSTPSSPAGEPEASSTASPSGSDGLNRGNRAPCWTQPEWRPSDRRSPARADALESDEDVSSRRGSRQPGFLRFDHPDLGTHTHRGRELLVAEVGGDRSCDDSSVARRESLAGSTSRANLPSRRSSTARKTPRTDISCRHRLRCPGEPGEIVAGLLKDEPCYSRFAIQVQIGADAQLAVDHYLERARVGLSGVLSEAREESRSACPDRSVQPSSPSRAGPLAIYGTEGREFESLRARCVESPAK